MNEFDELLVARRRRRPERRTSSDETGYFYSLPANKFELWAYLESERFLDPVFREFYKERDVVMEERRMRTESQPIGRLVERFVVAAFSAHPYSAAGRLSQRPRTLHDDDAKAFFDQYYVPSNLVTTIVGGVKAQEIIPVLEKYFGRLPPGRSPSRCARSSRRRSPSHADPKDPSQPFYVEGYHQPPALRPDDPVYDALADILTAATHRAYRPLVQNKKIAVPCRAARDSPA